MREKEEQNIKFMGKKERTIPHSESLNFEQQKTGKGHPTMHII